MRLLLESFLFAVSWILSESVSTGNDIAVLPRLHLKQKTIIENDISQSIITIQLDHIPKFLVDGNQVEVTFWKRADGAETRYFADYIQLNSSAITYRNESHKNLMSGLYFVIFGDIATDTTFKAVMRLLFDDRFASASPSPDCLLPSYCEEIVVLAPKPFDWIKKTDWISPSIDSSHMLSMVQAVSSSLSDALANASHLDAPIQSIRGLSGIQFRHFLNNLGARVGNCRYLEVGVFYGSTLFSMLFGNAISAVAIDPWDNNINNYLGDLDDAFEFVTSSLPLIKGSNQVHILRDNGFDVDILNVLELLGGPVNVYFYDAGHRFEDHFLGLCKFLPILDDAFIYIIDDWNEVDVREGTLTSIAALQLRTLYQTEIRTAGNSEVTQLMPLWHNGMAVFILAIRSGALTSVINLNICIYD